MHISRHDFLNCRSKAESFLAELYLLCRMMHADELWCKLSGKSAFVSFLAGVCTSIQLCIDSDLFSCSGNLIMVSYSVVVSADLRNLRSDYSRMVSYFVVVSADLRNLRPDYSRMVSYSVGVSADLRNPRPDFSRMVSYSAIVPAILRNPLLYTPRLICSEPREIFTF